MIRKLALNFASDSGLTCPFLVFKRNVDRSVGANYDDETMAHAIVRSPNGSSPKGRFGMTLGTLQLMLASRPVGALSSCAKIGCWVGCSSVDAVPPMLMPLFKDYASTYTCLPPYPHIKEISLRRLH